MPYLACRGDVPHPTALHDRWWVGRAVDGLQEAHKVRGTEENQAEVAQALAAGREQADAAAWSAAWAEGRAMTLEQAIAAALEETSA